MTQPQAVQVQDLFRDLQSSLLTQLSAARSHVHPTVKGDISERAWVEMLRSHLPERYSVDSGIVLDSRGGSSDQIDVVIYDRQYSFRPFEHQGTVYFAAESVYAVFEVKPELDMETVVYASNKAASVRRLYRTNGAIRHASGSVEKHQVKPLPHIHAGLLATRAGIASSLSEYLPGKLAGLSVEQELDLGCVAQVGAFGVEHEGKGASVRQGSAEFALVDFLLDLLERLRLSGTTPAIEFNEYARWVR